MLMGSGASQPGTQRPLRSICFCTWEMAVLEARREFSDWEKQDCRSQKTRKVVDASKKIRRDEYLTERHVMSAYTWLFRTRRNRELVLSHCAFLKTVSNERPGRALAPEPSARLDNGYFIAFCGASRRPESRMQSNITTILPSNEILQDITTHFVLWTTTLSLGNCF